MKKATVTNDDVREKQITQKEYLEKEFETISIPSSDSPIYEKLLRYKPTNYNENIFVNRLKGAMRKTVKGFKIFVNDPSINNGKLQFLPGCKVAVGYSYNEWKRIAKRNGLRLGEIDEYILFIGWLINSLVNEGWSEADARFAIFTDSRVLGHYCNSENAKETFELTGSRKVAGKCDLSNTCKILARDRNVDGFWVVSGSYDSNSNCSPIAHFGVNCNYVGHYDDGVGWFVL